jgi:hypothetical protein
MTMLVLLAVTALVLDLLTYLFLPIRASYNASLVTLLTCHPLAKHNLNFLS